MRSTAPRSADISDRTTTVADVAGGIDAREPTRRGGITTGERNAAKCGTRIGYRIRLGDDEDVLRQRTLTGAIAAHLLKAASTTPDA
jgi:hypothetical protein